MIEFIKDKINYLWTSLIILILVLPTLIILYLNNNAKQKEVVVEEIVVEKDTNTNKNDFISPLEFDWE